MPRDEWGHTRTISTCGALEVKIDGFVWSKNNRIVGIDTWRQRRGKNGGCWGGTTRFGGVLSESEPSWLGCSGVFEDWDGCGSIKSMRDCGRSVECQVSGGCIWVDMWGSRVQQRRESWSWRGEGQASKSWLYHRCCVVKGGIERNRSTVNQKLNWSGCWSLCFNGRSRNWRGMIGKVSCLHSRQVNPEWNYSNNGCGLEIHCERFEKRMCVDEWKEGMMMFWLRGKRRTSCFKYFTRGTQITTSHKIDYTLQIAASIQLVEAMEDVSKQNYAMVPFKIPWKVECNPTQPIPNINRETIRN